MENFHFGQKVCIYGYGSQIFEISEVYEDFVRLRREGGPTLLGKIPFKDLKPPIVENTEIELED